MINERTINLAVNAVFHAREGFRLKYDDDKKRITVYETTLDPTTFSTEEKEAARFLLLSFTTKKDETEVIWIDVLRKTERLSGKRILDNVYEVANLLNIPEICLVDKANIEFDIEVLSFDQGSSLESRKRIVRKEEEEKTGKLCWHTMIVKTIPLSPLLILCGEPSYYAAEGFLAKDQVEINEYNKSQVEMTMREIATSPKWPICNMEIQEKEMSCLDPYWDLPVRVFFQDVKSALRKNTIPEGIRFEFVKTFIEDLVECEFIKHNEYSTLHRLKK
uniref:Uncharacterized protein n=1 Tax=viral metagenome TaxID=1070528 RepID=A0A6C0I460_9ZZZZ